jgi:Cys-tRNA(Pro)/Cys-tRNA(Cys) deacylase
MRLLDARQIAYRATVYDPSGAFHSAEEAASLIEAPVEQVYKTLVVLRDALKGKPILVMIPADREVDLKRLAHELSEKKLRMATQKQAEELTGLQVGGISALVLLNKGFQICLDASAIRHEKIHISAGVRGVDIELGVQDLVALTNARIVSTV